MKKLNYQIIIALLTILLFFTQYKLNKENESLNKLKDNIQNTILSGLYVNFNHIQESLLFIELHNFQLHNELNLAKKIENKILKKRKNLIKDYSQLSNIEAEELNKEINEILTDQEIDFGNKYNKLTDKHDSIKGSIQSNVFNKNYARREQISSNISLIEIIQFTLTLCIFLSSVVMALYTFKRKSNSNV